MHYDFIKNLLNLKGVNVTKLRNRKNKINIHIELSVIPHKCPCCHSMTTKIHDYRNQEIKDIPLYDKRTVLIYRKRRFICKVCGKKFYEKNSFVAKNGRKTLRLTEYIIDQLRKKQSIKDIAKSSKVSSSTIFNLLPSFSVTAHTLPEVLCIDEFRGNVDEDSKYQVALLNGKTGETIDIIHNRLKDTLYDYFNHFSLDERKKVKYFVTDLWSTYKS